MFAMLRLLMLLAVIAVVAVGSLLFVGRATCFANGESGKKQTQWSISLPGAKPEAGCIRQQTGLSYLLDQLGIKS